MKETPYTSESIENEETINLKEEISKYLGYWPWFVGAVVLGLFIAYGYLRWAPVTYKTEAKIKIVDDAKEMNIATDALSLLKGKPNIILNNEIEILKSYRLLSQVVAELQLDVTYLVEGKIKSSPIWNPPFQITRRGLEDDKNTPKEYAITLNSNSFIIVDDKDKAHEIHFDQLNVPNTDLPFDIHLQNNIIGAEHRNLSYKVILNPFKQAVLNLKQNLQVQATNKESEVLSLTLTGQSIERSEAILNSLIDNFNQDGIEDRQLISKRTLDFIDERFVHLSQELDSIEGNKKEFKRQNKLSYIEADAGISLQKKSGTEAELFQLETQIELSDLLARTLAKEAGFGLLPSDIGLDNTGLNTMVNEYNDLVLQYEKVTTSAGRNNPTVQVLYAQLERAKRNVLLTVQSYQDQLKVTKNQLTQQNQQAVSTFSKIPQKEKLLRAIERQQSIKENLYLILLQKREEAAINLAVTAPSVKVVDYALTLYQPVAPKKTVIMAGAFIAGILLPFGFLYLRFSLDTKIRSRSDIEMANPEVPIIGEIPFNHERKLLEGRNDRSVHGEVFRILSSNLEYVAQHNKGDDGQVIYVTSSIKGEGKTFVAANLALTLASYDKKVLLIGSDMRNPQLHGYFEEQKGHLGLSDYLKDEGIHWRKCLLDKPADHLDQKVLLSGNPPPNPTWLLKNPRFADLLTEAKESFDHIIVDTAPTLLVSDTLLISQLADVTINVVRAGYTEKNILEHSGMLQKENRLKNMVYILNDVGPNNSSGYGYGYNYGYGYGYSEEGASLLPWYRKRRKRG